MLRTTARRVPHKDGGGLTVHFNSRSQSSDTTPTAQGSQRVSKHGKDNSPLADCLKVVHRKKAEKATESLYYRKFQVKLLREKASDLYNSKDICKF